MALVKELKKLVSSTAALFDLSSLLNPAKPIVSANIICKNSIDSIAISLYSLVDVVDEVVVVDTGSDDGTLEFLKQYLADNFEHYLLIQEQTFKGYSYHRNQAIEASKGDWIIVIDSDEFLSESCRDKLRDLVKTKIYSAFRFYRRWINSFDDKQANYVSTDKFKGCYKPIIRLFRKLDSVSYKGDMHEAVHGLETKRVKTLTETRACLYHLDTAINSFDKRKAKVDQRESLFPGSGHAPEYLPELYDLDYLSVPDEDLEILSKANGKTIQKTI